MTSLIYFAQAGEGGPIKIGITANDPRRRMVKLQADCPSTVSLLGVIPGDEGRERAIHARFRDERIQGEWFRPAAALVDWIAAALTLEAVALPEKPKATAIQDNWHPIRKWRARTDTTLAELSEMTGLSEPQLSQIENGKKKIGPDKLQIMYRVTGIPPRALRLDLWAILFGDDQQAPAEAA